MRAIIFVLLLVSNAFAYKSPGELFTDIYFDDDIPSELKRQVEEDLLWLKQLAGQSSSDLHNFVFQSQRGESVGETYLRYFLKRVKVFGYLRSFGEFQNLAEAHGDTLYLTENYNKYISKLGRPIRLSVIMHESRHLEKNEYSHHVKCPVSQTNPDEYKLIKESDKPAPIKPACDNSAFGANAAMILFLNEVGRSCITCSQEEKSEALVYRDRMLKRIISEEDRHQLLSGN